jgi:hypothetical protein
VTATVKEHYAEQYPTKRDDGTPNFVEYRRVNQIGGIGIVYGLIEPGSLVGRYVQAIRFAKDMWSVERAKAWLAVHGYRADHFQAALDPPPKPPKAPKLPKAKAARKKLPMEQLSMLHEEDE